MCCDLVRPCIIPWNVMYAMQVWTAHVHTKRLLFAAIAQQRNGEVQMADDECGNALACLQVQWPLPHCALPYPCLPGPALPFTPLPGPPRPCPPLSCPPLPCFALPSLALPCPPLPCPALPSPPLPCPHLLWYLACCHVPSLLRSRAQQDKTRQGMQDRAWPCLDVPCCIMS